MKRFIHLGLVLTMITGLAGAIPTMLVKATSEIVINSDDIVNTYTLPAESNNKVEPAMAEGYIQSNSKKPNLQKVSLQAYSDSMTNYIKAQVQLPDGNYLVALDSNNHRDHVDNTATIYVQSIMVLKVDKNGNVLKRFNIADGGTAIQTSQSSSIVGQSAYLWGSFFQDLGNGRYGLYYSGQAPSESSIKNRVVSIDNDLENPQWAPVDTNGYVMNQGIGYTTIITNDDRVVHHGFVDEGRVNQSTFDYYYLDPVSGKYTGHFQLEVPDWEDITGPGVSKPSNWFIASSSAYIEKTADGGFLTAVEAGNHSYNPDSYVAIVKYDSSGNIQWLQKLKTSLAVPQEALTDSQYIYSLIYSPIGRTLQETSKLVRFNITTGDMEVLKEYPQNTNVVIIPKADVIYGTEYAFYGYVGDASGEFAGYGEGGGAVTGTMNDDFSLYNASIVSTNGIVTLSQFQIDDAGNIFTSGGMTSNTTDFAQAPGGIWATKTPGAPGRIKSNAFFGSMKQIEDYAPGIKTNGGIMINKDTIVNWDNELLAGVEVTDTFDLDTAGGNHTQAWLSDRINRNPNDVSLDYDWTSLGMDKSQTGFNKVSYFVTDSNKQSSVTSRNVNVVSNGTAYDPAQTLALDAHNFDIPLADVAALTEPLSKTRAQVKAWDMLDGSDATSTIAVDATELATIQNATIAQPYPLTFTVEKAGTTVTNTITVFVTDGNTIVDPNNDAVMYAQDFVVQLAEAPATTDEQAKTLANPKVYRYSEGTAMSGGVVTADGTNIRNATEVGPVNVQVTYRNGFVLAKNVTASIVDDNTQYDGKQTAALYAKNFAIALADAATLDATSAKINAQVKAWNMGSGADITANVALNAAELATIQQATIAQPYPLTFTVVENDVVVSNTITVFVTDDNTQVDPANNVVLYADNFVMQLADAPMTTDTHAVTLANAHAYNFNTGAELAVSNISSEASAIRAATTIGPVPLPLTYTDGAVQVSTSVIASLVDEHTLVENDEVIRAADFQIDISEVSALTEEQVIQLAGTKAWNMKTGDWLAFATDYSKIQAQVGSYEVTFTTAAGTMKAVIATVTDSNANTAALPVTGDDSVIMGILSGTLALVIAAIVSRKRK